MTKKADVKYLKKKKRENVFKSDKNCVYYKVFLFLIFIGLEILLTKQIKTISYSISKRK